MQARYTGRAWGMWKGLDLVPGACFDIPEALQVIVAGHPQFDVIEEIKRGPGRPRKVSDGDAA